MARSRPPNSAPLVGGPLPDTDGSQHRQHIPSSSGNELYLISQEISSGLWQCSCRGFLSTRNCKHLKALGVPTVPKASDP